MLRALAVLLLAALAGCAGHAPEVSTDVRRHAEIAGVPFYPQEESHCGPAALAMVLAWSGREVTPADTASLVFTPGRGGTFQHDILAAARRHDRLALEIGGTADLLAEVAAGHPVLVLQNLGLSWYPVWHYAVVVGYDLPAGEIVLHSGRERRRAISLETFERTWARGGRWGLVVLPPDRLPASGRKGEVVAAAAGLERAGDAGAAEAAYGAILERWPMSRGALIGLGNSRYARGDPAGAEAAFRRATLLHPDAAPAWNNLAHVLAERGLQERALAAARTAVALGGRHAATSRTTLREIAALPAR